MLGKILDVSEWRINGLADANTLPIFLLTVWPPNVHEQFIAKIAQIFFVQLELERAMASLL